MEQMEQKYVSDWYLNTCKCSICSIKGNTDGTLMEQMEHKGNKTGTFTDGINIIDEGRSRFYLFSCSLFNLLASAVPHLFFVQKTSKE